MMKELHAVLPKIAEKETRGIIILGENEELPKGKYILLESYCTDSGCDCRRVFINVLHGEKILATIGYGWENVGFYEQWLGIKDMAQEMKGPILELTGQQTEYSEALLKLFKKVILPDKIFVERLKNHYAMFKKITREK